MISYIVPVYNVEKYLRDCVDSILAQGYPDYEIILIDDGSTDNSSAICQAYALQDTCIKVIRQDHAGPSVARNAGIEIANGEFISFVDADDMLHPLFAKTMTGIIGDNNIAVCMWTRSRECRWPDKQNDKVLYLDVNESIETGLYQHLTLNSAWGKIYRRCVLDSLRFTPGIYYEDLEFFYLAFEQARKKIAVSLMQLYFYRDNGSSIMNNFSPRRLNVLDVTARIVKHYAGNRSLQKAARDRQFSANFNMLALTRYQEEYELENRACWNLIKQYRREVLFNPKSRLKNRIGALLSYSGKRITEFITTFIYR